MKGRSTSFGLIEQSTFFRGCRCTSGSRFGHSGAGGGTDIIPGIDAVRGGGIDAIGTETVGREHYRDRVNLAWCSGTCDSTVEGV
jgi:hypothetical protein